MFSLWDGKLFELTQPVVALGRKIMRLNNRKYTGLRKDHGRWRWWPINPEPPKPKTKNVPEGEFYLYIQRSLSFREAQAKYRGALFSALRAKQCGRPSTEEWRGRMSTCNQILGLVLPQNRSSRGWTSGTLTLFIFLVPFSALLLGSK